MMQYLRDGARILNCSWACYTKDGRPPFVLERALAVLTPKLLVVAAAGNHGQFWSKKKGEDGEKEDKKYREKNMLPARDAPAYPAALPNVVAVGASGPDGPATFNPIAWGTGAGGKERIAALAPWINVLAPGVAVRGPYFGDEREEEVRVPDKAPSAVREQKYRTKEFNGEAEWSGTSFATNYSGRATLTSAEPIRSPAVGACRAPTKPGKEGVHAWRSDGCQSRPAGQRRRPSRLKRARRNGMLRGSRWMQRKAEGGDTGVVSTTTSTQRGAAWATARPRRPLIRDDAARLPAGHAGPGEPATV